MKAVYKSFSALLFFCIGCAQHRNVVVPEVSHVNGPIETRHTYRLVRPHELKETFEKAYPGVFSSNNASIPFSLQEDGFGNDNFAGADILWAMLNGGLFACSCFSFPIIHSHEYRIKYKIKIGGDFPQGSGFTVRHSQNSHACLIGPLGLMFPYGEPEDPKVGRKYWRAYSTSIWHGEDDAREKQEKDKKMKDEALAFAVAVTMKKMEDEGRINPKTVSLAKQPPVLRSVPATAGFPVPNVPAKRNLDVKSSFYRIISCERDGGNDFAYTFVLKLTDEAQHSLRAFRSVQQEFRNALKEDYIEAFSVSDTRSLYVDFPLYRQNEDKIEGRAVVLTITVAALAYDPNTRKGKLAVKLNANQYEEARRWVRKNIETLARDKNIALTTGEIPPAARFYLGREELKEGNVLEVEFRTE